MDEYVLKICDVTMADLQDIGWTDRTKTTWVELCLLICEGWNKDMVADALRDAEEYRFALATAMVAYLAGTCKNIARQLWRATQLHKGILCFCKASYWDLNFRLRMSNFNNCVTNVNF